MAAQHPTSMLVFTASSPWHSSSFRHDGFACLVFPCLPPLMILSFVVPAFWLFYFVCILLLISCFCFVASFVHTVLGPYLPPGFVRLFC